MQEEFSKERVSINSKKVNQMKEYLEVQKVIAATSKRLHRGHAYRSSRSPRKQNADGTDSLLNDSQAFAAEK
jgi:hypothetical protein